MKKIIKRILAGLIIVLIVLQFFRPAANQAAGITAQDITVKHHVPENVRQILQRSCYDCHSNNTVYPWYSKIQPVAWYLDNHIQEGKRELNFSDFGAYAPKKAAHKLDEVITETEEHEMPIGSYTWLHPDTRLSEEEIRTITGWASALADSIRTAHNLPIKQ